MVAAEDGFTCGDPDHAGWTWEQDYAHHSRIAARAAAWRDAHPNPEIEARMAAERRARQRTKKARAQRLRLSLERHTEAQWEALKARYEYRCLCCGQRQGQEGVLSDGRPNPLYHVALVRDHIVPLSRGGSDALDNIQPLCTDCNTRKAQRTTDYRPQAARALDGE